MIGDTWTSKRTGNIYRVGPKNTPWQVIGHVDDGLFAGVVPFLGMIAALTGATLYVGVVVAVLMGGLVGVVLMFLPSMIPLTVVAPLLLLLVVGIRATRSHRPLRPVMLAAALYAVLLVAVGLHIAFWMKAFPGLYVTLASLPLMPILTLALAGFALSRRRWVIAALLLGQTVVFAASFLAAVGPRTYAGSGVGIDNVLTLVYWAFIGALVAAALTPRSAQPATAVPAEVAQVTA